LLARSNLTPRQLWIYAGQRLYPDIVLYDAVYAVTWPELQPGRFRQAWQWLLDSCDALRTIVEEINGVPCQRVRTAFQFDIEYIDLYGTDSAVPRLEDWFSQRLKRRVVLAERPFDTALIRTGAQEHVWYLNIHHLVADACAVELLIERLHELYSHGPEGLEPLPLFSAQIQRQRALLATPAHRADEEYWQQLLAGLPEPAAAYGIDAPQGTRQERVVLALGEPLGRAIEALARDVAGPGISQHAALFNVFAATFAMFLARVTDVEQVTVGSTFHNRHTATEKQTIGLLMEVLPLALGARPDDCLAGLAQQVAGVTAQALQHRTCSVANSSRMPLYQALINYMLPFRPPPPGLEVHRIHPGHGAHALALSVAPPARGHDWQLWLDINSALARAIGAARLAEQFQTFLEAAVREPRRSMQSLRVLPERQRAGILALCDGPLLPAGLQDRGCHESFERWAARTPHATAVIFDGGSVTYGELDRRANRLAHALIRLHGVRRGDLVGIHLERSAEMIVAVLAVLKSGAAYLPLDPNYPAARLQFMIDDAAPSVIVTSHAQASQLSAPGTRLLFVSAAAIAQREVTDESDPGVRVGREQLAYVMYTSGSTGTPKGVMVTHGSVVNYLEWRNSYFPLAPADRCLHKASLSFDDSVWEILEPLGVGASIVLARPRFEYDAAYLVELIASQAITAACLVPSLLRHLVDSPRIGSCGSLRRLTTGGETLSAGLQRLVLQRLPWTTLYNGYGATETTVASAFWQCTQDAQQSVPIGRPIANTRLFVLDEAGELLPPGVPGQLHVGGAGVAAGYWRRPELTAERFIVGAAGAPHERLYRTGDRGRLRPDGIFEFLGRTDQQVKIHGVRVEPAEAEAALADHPLVSGAAVLCSESAPGVLRLIAYVQTVDQPEPSATELRRFLRGRLPAALIPARFIFVESLPRTPSGKLDRRALAAIQDIEPPPEAIRCKTPGDESERRLLEIWKSALDVRPIGVLDEFFDIGGHSLLAVQVAAEIGRQFARRVPPGLLFEAPTIRALAQWLNAAQNASAPGALVRLRAGSAAVPLYCIHHVRGDANCYRELAGLMRSGQSVYGIEVGDADAAAGPNGNIAIETLAARYVDEIVTHQPVGPYALAGYSAGGLIAYEMACRLASTGRSVCLLAILDTDAGAHAQRVLLDPLRFHLSRLARLGPLQALCYPWRQLRARRISLQEHSRPARATPGPIASADPVMAALEQAADAYRPRPYCGSVTLFRATDRRITRTYSRTLGWGGLARGGVRVIDVPGDHRTIMQTGSVRLLANRLSECLPSTEQPAHASAH
jgi:amino acid adenylation domain-containing protein